MTDNNTEGTWLHQDLKELQSSGAWVCPAVDHNAAEGCSNPKCLRFKSLLRIVDEPFQKGSILKRALRRHPARRVTVPCPASPRRSSGDDRRL